MAEEGILFWLEALDGNGPAQEIIDSDANSFYRVLRNGRTVLKVGLQATSKVPGHLISFGRDPARNDLILSDSVYSKNHCHFFFNESTALILRDTSSTQSTEIRYPAMDDDSIYRLQGHPRQRVMVTKHPLITMHIGPSQFRILWHVPQGLSEKQALTQAKTTFAQKKVAPELDLTLPNLQSVPFRNCELRVQYAPSVATQYRNLPDIFHEEVSFLGSGTFGTVHKTLDLHTGNLLAVKTSKRSVSDKEHKQHLKREVEILAKLSHPNIMKFIHSQGWTIGSPVELFFSVHQGNLMSLITPHDCEGGLKTFPKFCPTLVSQVLHAVAYLHERGIIHRDIKPENILYDYNGNHSSMTFYIADFGLSKEQISTSPLLIAGTLTYMAPEIFYGKFYTSRCDIWSFALTIIFVFGYICPEDFKLPTERWNRRMALLPGYRSNLNYEADQRLPPLLGSQDMQHRSYGRLRSMVRHKMIHPLLMPLLEENPEARPDAQQCLRLFFPER